MARRIPSRLHRQRGDSLLETALVMVIIFTVTFWVFEVCALMYTHTVIADAAHEGVRYAIVHSGGDVSGTQAKVSTFAKLSMHNVSGISTSVTFPDGSATPPNRVRVTVTYSYVPWLNNVLSTVPTMHAYAEGRMVVQ